MGNKQHEVSMDFQHSAKAQDYLKRVKAFMKEEIEPVEEDYLRELHSLDNKWTVLPIIEELKAKARDAGLWNMFLPDEHFGAGLSTLEYAAVAELTGRSFIAPEIFNCNAPDTGNMEVLEKYGTPEQQEQWLTPLLAGEIRSAFCMTEPGVASSDATNMEATAVVEGDEVVLNGRKWWSTGVGHPNCKVGIFMGLTNPDAPRHQQHSMVLFPFDAPGVKIERMLPVFGFYDEPYGHADVIANARMNIEQARLLVFKAAWMIDKVGAMGAMSEISQIKVIAPNMAQQIIDAAMQMHGGGGLSGDFPLTGLFTAA